MKEDVKITQHMFWESWAGITNITSYFNMKYFSQLLQLKMVKHKDVNYLSYYA